MEQQSKTEAVLTFIRSSPWLTDADAPAITLLLECAHQLDTDPTAAWASQYGLTYRNLLSRAPSEPDAQDELAQLLKR